MTTLLDSIQHGHVGPSAGFANGTWQIRIGISNRTCLARSTTCSGLHVHRLQRTALYGFEIASCLDDLSRISYDSYTTRRPRVRLVELASMARASDELERFISTPPPLTTQQVFFLVLTLAKHIDCKAWLTMSKVLVLSTPRARDLLVRAWEYHSVISRYSAKDL